MSARYSKARQRTWPQRCCCMASRARRQMCELQSNRCLYIAFCEWPGMQYGCRFHNVNLTSFMTGAPQLLPG